MANRKGFTLIELMVVVIILGILASMAVPGYLKTNETAKATDAVGMMMSIATANRMYFIDNKVYVAGALSSTNALVGGVGKSTYLPDSGWSTLPYNYFSCDAISGAGGGCCAVGSVACASRKTSGTGATNKLPYNGWGYRVDSSGACSGIGTNVPSCPGM